MSELIEESRVACKVPRDAHLSAFSRRGAAHYREGESTEWELSDAAELSLNPAPRWKIIRDGYQMIEHWRAEIGALTQPLQNERRLLALDMTRVLATLGVMWTHLAEYQGQSAALAALGRFGTSFYIGVVVFLSVRSSLSRERGGFLGSAAVRARRLLLPFLLWSTIYALFYWLKRSPSAGASTQIHLWWGPFAGCALHLWFLPFAYFSGCVTETLAPLLARLPMKKLGAVVLFLSVTSYWFFYGKLFFWYDRIWGIKWHLHRLDRWIEEIPLVISVLGFSVLYERYLALQRANHRKDSRDAATGAMMIVLGGFVAIQMSYYYFHGDVTQLTSSEGRFMAHISGVLLLIASLLATPRVWMKKLGALTRFTYFAFLVHILLLDSANRQLAQLSGYGSIDFVLGSSVGLLCCSILIGWSLSQLKITRWLIP